MAIRVSLHARPYPKQADRPFFFFNSVVELHTFLVTLMRQFDFSLPESGLEVKWLKMGTPVVVGEEHKGPQLPLKVTVLGNE